MFKNKYILIRNLAVFFIICNLLYWIFPFPPIVWRIGLVLLSLFVIVFEKRRKSGLENAMLFFAVFNLIYFFVSYYWIKPSTTQIGNILCVMMSLSLFVCLGEKNILTDNFFNIFSVVLLLTCVLAYYQAQTMALEQIVSNENIDTTNNSTGLFLMILPMLFLIKKDWLKMVILTVCIFFLIMGAKRGNILAAMIPIILIVWYVLRDSRHSIGKTLLVMAVVVVIGYFSYDWFTTNNYLMYRLEETVEGNSSGRDVIYSNAWHAWRDSNSFIHYIFGFGFDGTINHPLMDHTRAHNDWLEILVDYGLLGLGLYFIIYFKLVRLIHNIKDLTIKMILLSVFFIWFFKSLYSMGFTEGGMVLLMISLGTALGRTKVSSLTNNTQ